MSVDTDTLLVERSGGVVTATMNRPARRNAMDATMQHSLLAVLREVRTRTDDRVLVLTGAGADFCSGADVSDPGSLTSGGLHEMRGLGELVLALHDLPKPTIAKVRGVAVGLGLNLALGCDLVVADEAARLSEIFARRGLSIDGGGSWLLPRLIGLHRAKELAFFADIVPTNEALGMGLLNRVVPPGDLDGLVDTWAARLAAGPPLALSMTKMLLNSSSAVSMAQAVEDEAHCQHVNFGSEDTAEAMRAFVEKREPSFRGL